MFLRRKTSTPSESDTIQDRIDALHAQRVIIARTTVHNTTELHEIAAKHKSILLQIVRLEDQLVYA